MFKSFILSLILFYFAPGILSGDGGSLKNDSTRVLSRRKRYLVFPEGSSFQLVYCLTVPSIGMGNIFTLGGTAALAWELPHDPFIPFKDFKDKNPSNRRTGAASLHSAGSWNMLNKKKLTSMNKKKTSNGLLSNYASDYAKLKGLLQQLSFKNSYSSAADQFMPSNLYQIDKQPITTYAHPVYHEIHRRTRRSLFSKIEKFFKAQNKDGKACLLKAICEVSKSSNSVGTFMEEILKTIFRAKPHDEYPDEDEYDLAANRNHNCDEVYHTCNSSVWNPF